MSEHQDHPLSHQGEEGEEKLDQDDDEENPSSSNVVVLMTSVNPYDIEVVEIPTTTDLSSAEQQRQPREVEGEQQAPPPTSPHNEKNGTTPEEEMEITEASDLSNIRRRIWIITTAGLPWRTGTAVNPLLRALYLTRQRPRHYVTLMIPWIANPEMQGKLYGGKDNTFESREQQETWIRQYCRERCDCTSEEPNLRILFWDGIYNDAFGSIFPTVDIVSLIPKEEADVAILEEPEHLNWFRVPAAKPNTTSTAVAAAAITDKSQEPSDDSSVVSDKGKVTESERKEQEENRLGWSHKFRHVVGILHTNYGAYIEQYGGMIAGSAIGAPALNGLSSLVVKAYCHRLIRLSATLPSLNPVQEVTSNVHGVRQEFINQQSLAALQEQQQKHGGDDESTPKPSRVYFIGKLIWAKGFYDVLELQEIMKDTTKAKDGSNVNGGYFEMDIYGSGNDEDAIKTAFLGRRRKKSRRKSSMKNIVVDIQQYEKDEAAEQAKHDMEKELPDKVEEDGAHEGVGEGSEGSSGEDEGEESDWVLGDDDGDETETDTERGAYDIAEEAAFQKKKAELLEDIFKDGGCGDDDPEEASDISAPPPKESHSGPPPRESGMSVPPPKEPSRTTRAETVDAAYQLLQTSLRTVFGTGRSGFKAVSSGVDEKKTIEGSAMSTQPPAVSEAAEKPKVPKRSKSPLPFGITVPTLRPADLIPRRARYRWRRTSLPVRFLGVQDHIVLRDIPETTIFLNMSTSEVLCTTTAEALAMGKFAIIPKHPSNEFFYQFPNCFAYSDLDDCAMKLSFALQNTPEPLSDLHAHILSWEGATERLYKAASITKAEFKKWEDTGVLRENERAAKFHVESGLKSQFVKNLFSGKILKETISGVSNSSN